VVPIGARGEPARPAPTLVGYNDLLAAGGAR
jgi:hypothetical protein